jgi:hypothetical protein
MPCISHLLVMNLRQIVRRFQIEGAHFKPDSAIQSSICLWPRGFLGQPHDNREMPIAAVLKGVARSLSADCRLNGCVDIAGSKIVAPGGVSIDVNADRGLTDGIEHRQIGDARNRLHRGLDLVCDRREGLRIIAEQLDRVLALDPRNRFLNVVLNVLREIEIDAGKTLDQPG